MYRGTILMTAKTTAQNIIEGIKAAFYLPVKAAGENPLNLIIKTSHVIKVPSVNDKHLSCVHK